MNIKVSPIVFGPRACPVCSTMTNGLFCSWSCAVKWGENEYTRDHALDRAVRASTICSGCGKTKDAGSVVCWPCFKGGDNPFKYFANYTPENGNLIAWLKAIGRPTLEEQGIIPAGE